MESDVVVDAPPAARTRAVAADVSLRPWPYPYRAALAICSDLDETPAPDDYFEMVRFLSSTDATALGRGVGLEVGNSIYFDMPPDQFSYWNADDAARDRIRALIRSGHIDCLHSFGDRATTRAHAARALDDLARHGCTLKVWIDHAVAPSNFGADIMRGFGDVAGSPVYHADLTCAFGIEYVWRGRVTSVIGQGVGPRLGGLVNAAHPLSSGLTVAKEAAKAWLARGGSVKYAPHKTNAILWRSQLRSGQPVWEFLRSNPSWAGVSAHDTADGFGEVVTDAMLDRLLAVQGGCVLYTHLGKMRQAKTLTSSSRQAFERLAARAHGGDVLVTTTRRLLDFCRSRQEAAWTVTHEDGAHVIRVTAPSAVDGLSFYVDDPARVRLIVNGAPMSHVEGNPPDRTGRASVSIPWRRLTLPAL